ncbi:MAG TPA: hypothetical protein VME70_05040 [Mycobacteriales bacterium]|nr:hypothetical protein [Mycobacteriales bacterium]
MSSVVIAIIVIVVVVAVALAAVSFVTRRRAEKLRGQFGPEYDRAVSDHDSRRKAERELRERTERRERLEIVPLTREETERYRAEWRLVQERFVDVPAESLAMTKALLSAAMSDRGYPTAGTDERASLLSVDHADVVQEYREGAAIEQRWRDTDSADTEDLRQAMQHYRAVFGRVVGAGADTEAGQTASRSRSGRA